MHRDLEKAKKILEEKDLRLVVVRDGRVVLTSDETGIKTLYEEVASGKDNLKGSYIADRIVGRASAFLMILGNISGVFTPIITSQALDALKPRKIEFHFERKVGYVKNKNGSGICPMEKMTYGIDDPQEAWKVLSEALGGGKD